MAESVLIDAGFLMALLSRRDHYHRWAAANHRVWPRPGRLTKRYCQTFAFIAATAARLFFAKRHTITATDWPALVRTMLQVHITNSISSSRQVL
jgi:hypothetical protein